VIAAVEMNDVVTVPGRRVYLILNEQVPLALSIDIQREHSIAEDTIIVSALSAKVPYVEYGDRVQVTQWVPGLEHIRVYNGFMQPLWTELDLQKAKDRGYDLQDGVIFVVHSIRVQATKAPGMARWRKVLFAYMMHNATDPARYFKLPHDRVVEYTSVVEI
jgi:KUP system potassium uptake protein